MIQQALGSWIPIPVVVIVIQSVAFAAMHGYDLLGNIGIMITGIVWGWLAVKTGGLEATICLHSANNVLTMMLMTVYPSTIVTVSTTIAGFLTDTIATILLASFAYYLCKCNGLLLSH